MKPTDRTRLTAALRSHVAAIATDMRLKMRGVVPAEARASAVRAITEANRKARKLHADEGVAEDFDVWTDLLSRRAAVLWVLKSVYVRVLEDRGLITPGRLLDPESQHLFETIAPHLGDTAFLRWIYRDLASKDGGLPELFSEQPAEVALPADALSRALIEFWRHRDADSTADHGPQWSFADEHFEGELMGDLYQELDPVVKERFALCQTPDFVRAFMLDRTLTPAIAEFGADNVRLLDPACGSGHFLIDGFKRLFAATAALHSDWSRREVALHVLARVVGVDLNDYACGLARARIIMTAAELAGISGLADAAPFHPHVYWADGLEQMERDDANKPAQTDLFSRGDEPARATLTRGDVRSALKKVFATKFHAVVANPPYILEQDDARKAYHREKIGKDRRYISATGKYSLGAPFTERCFQLAENEGFIGIITSNAFMKREFGKVLIERVLVRFDITLIADTSQAYIPYHGTPTVLIFGRKQLPTADTIRTVMGKRGESGTPEIPALGKVWKSILDGWNHVGFENEYVSVTDSPRLAFASHPWSLGGGGAAELKEFLDAKRKQPLGDLADSIGYTTICGEDPVYLGSLATHARTRKASISVPLVAGDALRDWCFDEGDYVLFPYESPTTKALDPTNPIITQAFWRHRTLLKNRTIFHQTLEQKGMAWYEHMYRDKPKLRTPLSIAFAFVATHNHFVLDRGGKVFKQTAPVIKLPAGATEDEHLALLGLLNSSTACFWLKQMCQAKTGTESWSIRYEFDATKMKSFPITDNRNRTIELSNVLDNLASTRAAGTVEILITTASADHLTGSALLNLLISRRNTDLRMLYQMVALQEELDWLCYALYGLDTNFDSITLDEIESIPPTLLPWCITFAQGNAGTTIGIDDDEGLDESESDWFKRHRWTPVKQLPTGLSAKTRKRIEARIERTKNNPALALIESPNFKRRWYNPDYAAQEAEGLRNWLADRVEATAKARGSSFTRDHMVNLLQDDARVTAVGEVLTGRNDFSLSELVANVLQDDSVPNHASHIYKPAGMIKHAVWQRTWADQRREDAGEKVTPTVPPSYGTGDYLKTEYWQLRGKLDVPKERFIAFTEVPGRSGAETLYGWAGWTPTERIKALLSMDEELEDAGVAVADRIGVLDSAWRLLPDIARDDAAAASRFKAELTTLLGANGPSREQLDDWQLRFPPPSSRSAGKAKAAGKSKASADADDASDDNVGSDDGGDGATTSTGKKAKPAKEPKAAKEPKPVKEPKPPKAAKDPAAAKPAKTPKPRKTTPKHEDA